MHYNLILTHVPKAIISGVTVTWFCIRVVNVFIVAVGIRSDVFCNHIGTRIIMMRTDVSNFDTTTNTVWLWLCVCVVWCFLIMYCVLVIVFDMVHSNVKCYKLKKATRADLGEGTWSGRTQAMLRREDKFKFKFLFCPHINVLTDDHVINVVNFGLDHKLHNLIFGAKQLESKSSIAKYDWHFHVYSTWLV